MRTPLALRLSPAVRAVLVRRAVAAGVDPDGPDFAQWVGDLLAEGLPTVVGEVLLSDHEVPSDAATPSALTEGATSGPCQIIAESIVPLPAQPRSDGASVS